MSAIAALLGLGLVVAADTASAHSAYGIALHSAPDPAPHTASHSGGGTPTDDGGPTDTGTPTPGGTTDAGTDADTDADTDGGSGATSAGCGCSEPRGAGSAAGILLGIVPLVRRRRR